MRCKFNNDDIVKNICIINSKQTNDKNTGTGKDISNFIATLGEA